MGDFTYRQTFVGLGKETTRGTLANATMWYKWLTRDYRDRNQKVENSSAVGTLDGRDGTAIVQEWSAGKIGGKVTDKGFGLLMVLTFGADPTSVAKIAPNTSVFDHTWSLMANTVLGRSGTLYLKDSNKDIRFGLVICKTVEITIVADDYVKWEAELVGKKSAATTSTPALADENEFVPRHVTLKIAANTAGLSGATRIPVKSFKLKLDRKTEPYFDTNGNNDPSDIFAQEYMIEGEFTMRYSDDTYRTLWQANTERAMSINVTNTDVTIGTSANPGFVFTMPSVFFEDWEEDGDRSKITEQTIKFKAYYSIAAGKTIDCVVTNLQTSY